MFLVLSILCNRYSKSTKVHPWGPKPQSFLSDGVTLCQPSVITQSRKKSVSTSLSTHDRTPSVGHCLGFACFQSISAATTANVSPSFYCLASKVWYGSVFLDSDAQRPLYNCHTAIGPYFFMSETIISASIDSAFLLKLFNMLTLLSVSILITGYSLGIGVCNSIF